MRALVVTKIALKLRLAHIAFLRTRFDAHSINEKTIEIKHKQLLFRVILVHILLLLLLLLFRSRLLRVRVSIFIVDLLASVTIFGSEDGASPRRHSISSLCDRAHSTARRIRFVVRG